MSAWGGKGLFVFVADPLQEEPEPLMGDPFSPQRAQSAQRGRPKRLGRRKWRGDIYSDLSGVFPLRIARVWGWDKLALMRTSEVSINVNKLN